MVSAWYNLVSDLYKYPPGVTMVTVITPHLPDSHGRERALIYPDLLKLNYKTLGILSQNVLWGRPW